MSCIRLHYITAHYITLYNITNCISLYRCQLENREKQTASKIVISSFFSDSFPAILPFRSATAEFQAVSWEELRITTSDGIFSFAYPGPRNKRLKLYQVISSYESQKWAGHLFVLVQHGKTSADVFQAIRPLDAPGMRDPPGAATSRMLSPRPNPGRLAPVKALDLSGIKIGRVTPICSFYIYISLCIYICVYVYIYTHIYNTYLHMYIYI